MADMVVVGDSTQALPLLDHSDCVASLMRGQLWLGVELDASFLGGGPPTIGASQDAGALVLSQGRQKGKNPSADRCGQI